MMGVVGEHLSKVFYEWIPAMPADINNHSGSLVSPHPMRMYGPYQH